MNSKTSSSPTFNDHQTVKITKEGSPTRYVVERYGYYGDQPGEATIYLGYSLFWKFVADFDDEKEAIEFTRVKNIREVRKVIYP